MAFILAFHTARRIGRAGLVLGAIGAAVAVGGALFWTFSTASLTANAGALDSVDLALGSSAVTRAAANHAVVVAVNHASGSASAAALEVALAELADNAAALEVLAAQFRGTEAQLVAGLVAEADMVASLIGSGDVDAARAVAEGPLQLAYESSIGALSQSRVGLVTALEASAAGATTMGTWLRVTVIMILPAVAFAMARRRERRGRRAERAELVGELATAESRVDASNRLLVDASHRIRTPLTSMYGLAEVLAQSKRVRGLERELASLVHAESAELYRIADDVLVTAQQQTGGLRASAEIVALAETVEEAVKPYRSAGFEVKVDCPQVWVLSDAAKVRQIVRNLVSNAAKHGAEPIFVEVGEVQGHVECAVIDHGQGLSQEIVPADGRFGEGLGLRVASLLSELIGASLTYRRDDGRTRFTLVLAPDGPTPPGGMTTGDVPPGTEPSADRTHS